MKHISKSFLQNTAKIITVSLLAGCSTTEPSPGTNTVLGGAAVGAAVGAGIGSVASDGDSRAAGMGALAGAAAGALGGLAANQVNQRRTVYPVAERDKKNRRYVISPFDNTRLFVGDIVSGEKLRDPQGRVFVVGD
jgi:outer membrane lipoprotein SlyB